MIPMSFEQGYTGKREKGLTLVEVLVVIVIALLLVGATIPLLRSFQQEADLESDGQTILNILRLAQSRTLASEGNSTYGVSFDTAPTPHQYILFKGSSFALREGAFDETYKLSLRTEIFSIALSGGGTELVFEKASGTTNKSGTISVRLKDDPSKVRVVTINPSGRTTLDSETAPSDAARLRDSRHTHIDYTGRTIDTLTEKLRITGDAFSPVEIDIASNMEAGQISWEGTIDAGGQIQKLKIHTHLLNDVAAGTQFCVHRDRGYNNRHIHVELSGDATGDLIQYADNGDTTQGTSLYVASPIWQ